MTRLGNLAAEKNSRMARRYATQATDKGMKNDNSPVRLKFRAQMVSAISRVAPNPYSLCEGANFTNVSRQDQAARPRLAIRGTNPQSLALSQERGAIRPPEESSRLRYRCHRTAP